MDDHDALWSETEQQVLGSTVNAFDDTAHGLFLQGLRVNRIA
jgi:hypothetical protein